MLLTFNFFGTLVIIILIIIQVDVIVNTVGSSVQLTQGAVSNAIQTLAGPSLQQECDVTLRQKNLTKLAAGDYIVTGAGMLYCKEVYHIVCDSYSNPKSEQVRSIKK